MDKYVVNDIAQESGEHEVHKEGCHKFPSKNTVLGYFNHCKPAVDKAATIYPNVDGCAHCCPECHTK